MPQVFFTLFHFETITVACSARMSAENKLCRQIVENDGHEKCSQKNHWGKSGGYILCDFRTGSPGNSAKVGAIEKIHVMQWTAQAEPEFPLECPTET
jgi:hypothetical protein